MAEKGLRRKWREVKGRLQPQGGENGERPEFRAASPPRQENFVNYGQEGETRALVEGEMSLMVIIWHIL